jgi:hypothetical protein
MPIQLGTEQAEITTKRVTWRVQLDAYHNGERIDDPTIEVFRATKKQFGDTTIFTPDSTPLQVRASELEALADFAEIPPEIAALIRPELLPDYLRAMPLLVQMTCDAVERKAIADKAAAEQATREAENTETEVEE